jgi:hypothetical protein
LPKRPRPLNVIHGSARSAKFNRARGNSPGLWRVTFAVSGGEVRDPAPAPAQNLGWSWLAHEADDDQGIVIQRR